MESTSKIQRQQCNKNYEVIEIVNNPDTFFPLTSKIRESHGNF